jgi:hypothetical protein
MQVIERVGQSYAKTVHEWENVVEERFIHLIAFQRELTQTLDINHETTTFATKQMSAFATSTITITMTLVKRHWFVDFDYQFR